MKSQSRSRRPLILVTLLFLVPLAIAFLLYYGGVWRPAGSTEHGDLIHPARPLPEVVLPTPDGVTDKTFLREMWTLVYIGDGQCDARCQQALADIVRVREMLGKDSLRVRSAFLVSSGCCAIEQLKQLDAKLTIAQIDSQIDAKDATEFQKQFPLYGNVPIATAGRIYIVDPLGNLMMSYAPSVSSIGVYNDLKKLLKLSHIG